MTRLSWAILTGEYPPQPGGVSDYTRLVARELAAAGDEVHVWAPPWAERAPGEPGVRLHRLSDHFGPRGLKELDGQLEHLPPGTRLLVQYVPQGFGYRGMNVPFCLWLARRGRRQEVWTLFHEVALALGRRQPLRHNVLGAVHRAMATLVARSSRRVFVTIPGWAELLRPLVPARQTIEWLPVPATMPTEGSAAEVAAVRARVVGNANAATVVGHFGTYGSAVSDLLFNVLPPLLGPQDRRGLLIGRGSDPFADELVARHPLLTGRVAATGGLQPAAVAAHVAACDVMIQPYPDGLSCRRTSLMLPLSLGLPVVTCCGRLTEPFWQESRAVALAPAPEAAGLRAAAEAALNDSDFRRDLSRRGRALYFEKFDVHRTVAALRTGRGAAASARRRAHA